MIHAFGTCNVLSCSTENPDRDINSWVKYAADIIGLDYANYGQKSVDNNYIYHKVISNLDLFEKDDIILVGWADVSSRLFSSDNVSAEVLNDSLTYPGLGTDLWIRSKGKKDGKWDGNFNYRESFGNDYYDTYFQNYYNEHIAQLELLQKVSSLHSILNDYNIKHIFTADKKLSMDIVKNVNWFYPSGLGIVEFTKHVGAISKTNCHLSNKGHEIVGELFVGYYSEL